MLEGKPAATPAEKAENGGIEANTRHIQGHDNSVFSADEHPAYIGGKPSVLTNHLQSSASHKPQIQESSRL